MPRTGTYRGQPLLSNHQKSWLWGTIPVWETLQENRWAIYELVVNPTSTQPLHQQCIALAQQQQIPIREETSARLKQLCGSTDHQGILALMGEFPYTDIAQILKPKIAPENNSDVVVLLDRLQDPFNVGAIIRSAAAFGVKGVIFGSQLQVGITSYVARSSVGTVNQLPICQVESLEETVTQLKRNGYQILATTLEASVSVTKIRGEDLTQHQPVVVIIGNEATGVSPGLLTLCDAHVSIPMKGTAESLNAAVAAGIFLYELTK